MFPGGRLRRLCFLLMRLRIANGIEIDARRRRKNSKSDIMEWRKNTLFFFSLSPSLSLRSSLTQSLVVVTSKQKRNGTSSFAKSSPPSAEKEGLFFVDL